METIVERAAGLDVHKAQVTACVRVPGRGGGRTQQVAEFQSTVRGLLALREWLRSQRVTQVAMEASGVYWKPVWAILEDEFDCLLCNARHVKQVPGRKTRAADAAWLCQLLEAGLLRRSFVPPKPIRSLRNLTRYRSALVSERQREANRLHNAPSRTRGSSSTAWPRTSSVSPAGRCWRRSVRANATPRYSPNSPAASCGRRSLRSRRRSKEDASSESTRSSSPRSLPTSTSSPSKKSDSHKRSSSSSTLSPLRLNCRARSPASRSARPR